MLKPCRDIADIVSLLASFINDIGWDGKSCLLCNLNFIKQLKHINQRIDYTKVE